MPIRFAVNNNFFTMALIYGNGLLGYQSYGEAKIEEFLIHYDNDTEDGRL